MSVTAPPRHPRRSGRLLEEPFSPSTSALSFRGRIGRADDPVYVVLRAAVDVNSQPSRSSSRSPAYSRCNREHCRPRRHRCWLCRSETRTIRSPLAVANRFWRSGACNQALATRRQPVGCSPRSHRIGRGAAESIPEIPAGRMSDEYLIGRKLRDLSNSKL